MGNIKSYRFIKNSDASDVCIYEGNTYFEMMDKMAKELSKAVSVKGNMSSHEHSSLLLLTFSQTKVGCESLKVVQDIEQKKGAKGKDISGVFNIQCLHIMVMMTTDLWTSEESVYCFFLSAIRLIFP
jgi:hypothetical protein